MNEGCVCNIMKKYNTAYNMWPKWLHRFILDKNSLTCKYCKDEYKKIEHRDKKIDEII